MKKKLALIHTSMVFVKAETMMSDIFAEVMPEVDLVNIVDDSLLPEVEETGLPVLTSPQLGIEYVKRLLDSMEGDS